MSAGKIVLLVMYVVLAGLVLTQGESTVGIWSLRLLLILVVVHAIEVVAFFKVCKEAGGSLPGHLLNVFLFGVLHVNDIKAAKNAG
jgi:uncharacterized protein YhhL (DUF1145 family)